MKGTVEWLNAPSGRTKQHPIGQEAQRFSTWSQAAAPVPAVLTPCWGLFHHHPFIGAQDQLTQESTPKNTFLRSKKKPEPKNRDTGGSKVGKTLAPHQPPSGETAAPP